MNSQSTSGRCTTRQTLRGNAAIELAFMAPWLFFLFIGVLDFGFYAYAAICTQNAARIAVLQTSMSSSTAADSSVACRAVLPEMNRLPNATTLTSCATAANAVNTSLPIAAVSTSIPAASSADGQPASRVDVTYQSIPMIPIPGLLMGQLTLTRSAEMRVRE